MSKFVKGAIILILAGFITRILGFINRVVIARVIGEEGVGLYMMAFPTFILVITLTQLGLPVAISKCVAEAEAQGDKKKVKKILVVSLATTLSLSLIFTPALLLLAPVLSDLLFTDPRTIYPLMAIAPVIPIIAISSVIRGYFQGRQNMKPAALSQVIEQFVRILLIAFMTKAFMPYGVEYAAAAAMVASIMGELVSLIYLLTMFKLKKHFRVRKKFFQSIQSGKDTFGELMSVALPTLGSRMIGSVSWFFEPIVVAHSLALAGVAAQLATKQYGALTGFALPLLFLPSFITYALSTSLVPAISEANSLNNRKLVESRLNQTLRFSYVTGGLSVVILFVLAEPLMEAMYGSSNGSDFIKVMAPFFVIYYVQGPLAAVLQALDMARAAMYNSLFGNLAKLATIFLLASNPKFGIMGAALGMVVGMVLVTFLHYFTVLKTIQFSINVRELIKVMATMLLTGWFGGLILGQAHSLPLVLKIIVATLVMTCLYLLLVGMLGLVKKEETDRIPYIGGFLSRLTLIQIIK
ncbi:stage V sporulation protein B [Bacillus carboniphilus]|uniref:Stage V sporulation protein B n=1 Tax=Bacillus carboniphilus TaxID=86663 RepID=A0ABN0WDZ2_9BACI